MKNHVDFGTASRSFLLMATVFVVAAVLGCSGDITSTDADFDDGGVADLRGDVKIDGSSTVYPMSEAVAAAFKKEFPNVNVTVGQSGTGGGFKRFTVGETDISNASRPIKDSEFAECQRNKVEFVELPVAYDGLTIAVNPENDWVKELTIEQLQKIFLDEGAAQNWKDVDPSWPEIEIKIFAPGTDSGTYDYFEEVVTDGVDDDRAKFRDGISTSEDDGVLVTGVAGEKGAIGYFGASYYFENKDKLRAIPIVNPEGNAVAPTAETIESGEYAPFSRPLFIYVKVAALRRPEMKKFVQFNLAHAREMAEQVGYVALPDEIYQTAADNSRTRKSGTHYWTPEGEKRSGPLSEIYKPENLNSGA